MFAYFIKRSLLIIPTLFGILLINFMIIQFAPGGPVDKIIAMINNHNMFNADMVNQGSLVVANNAQINSKYMGAKGLDARILEDIKKQYGFDKPLYVRFMIMLKQFISFDFGTSFFKGKKVIDLIIERLPVSISLGLWSSLLIYFISIPLGIKKAVRNGSKFDFYTSLVIFIGYAIPAFLFAVLLIVLLGEGGKFPFFPISSLTSENIAELNFFAKIKDYFMHLVLPITALVVGGFASLTMLTKNSFVEEFNKEYVLTARAKGASENRVLYGHVFRNAMILVVSQIPESIIKMLFTGVLLIEIIFSLDGLGVLGFEAAMDRDYPVIFATIYLYSLIALVFNLVGDILYAVIDPRIDFETNIK
jgi:microcin C transport system permease protein